jgi:hypothetical protein
VVEHLPSKRKALSLNPTNAKNKKASLGMGLRLGSPQKSLSSLASSLCLLCFTHSLGLLLGAGSRE